MTASEPGTADDPPVPTTAAAPPQTEPTAPAAEEPPRRSCEAHGTAADRGDDRPWQCPTCLENYCRQQAEEQRLHWERHGPEILRRREENRRQWQRYHRPHRVFARKVDAVVSPILYLFVLVLWLVLGLVVWPVLGPALWLLHRAFWPKSGAGAHVSVAPADPGPAEPATAPPAGEVVSGDDTPSKSVTSANR